MPPDSAFTYGPINSPALAGALFAASFRAWPLLICGALKIIYDLLLLVQFRHIKPPEEQQ